MQRGFDVVVVCRFHRFARSVSHLLRALETFRALGAEFVSLSEQVDPAQVVALRAEGVPRRRIGNSTPHFSRNNIFPGNANLPIGVLPSANREIGVPSLAQHN